MPRFHFISGLPRSGSTLLSAILNQNPAFRAAMTSPLYPVFSACLSAMGGSNEFAIFLSPEQKARILRGIFEAHYADLTGPQPGGQPGAQVIFDTNRVWTGRLPALRQLFPQAKVIACVRNPAWVLDSVESLVRRNALDASRIFSGDAERATVFSRADALMQKPRLIGSAYLALKEAYYSAEAPMLLLVNYDTLVSRPKDTMALIYRFLNEPPFAHDFSDVRYQAEEFDTQMLTRGLHDVSGPVAPRPRPTILPPELFQRFAAMEFWGKGDSKAHYIRTQPKPAAGPTPA